MAVLIPLHIDKETGNIVARGGASGGVNNRGFLYEQLVPSDTWDVQHDQRNDRVLVQIYDEVGEFTIPNKIEIVDLNNIQITFGFPMEGTAHIMFFNSQQ